MKATYQRGVVYYGTGRKHNIKKDKPDVIDEAIGSIKTLRKYNPDVPVAFFGVPEDEERLRPYVDFFHLISDVLEEYGDQGKKVWHNTVLHPQWSWLCGLKIYILQNSPFEETFYLDTDTKVLGDITPIWQMGGLAMARELPRSKNEYTGVYNGGVIFFKKSLTVDWMIDWRTTWECLIRRATFTDQAAMPPKEVEGFTVLNPEVWNVRPKLANTLPLEKRKDTIILHSRFHTIQQYLSGE